jgi:hypothetical protein
MEVTNLPQAETIAVLLAGIVTLSLALKAALGPTAMYLTEQIKSAYPIRDGAGGLVALCVSLVLGGALGALAGVLSAGTDPGSVTVFVALGMFAGLFVSAGATESYKAAGLTNIDKSAAVVEVRKAAEDDARYAAADLLEASGKAELDRLRTELALNTLETQRAYQIAAETTATKGVPGTPGRGPENVILSPTGFTTAPATVAPARGGLGHGMTETMPDGGVAAAKAAGPDAGASCTITP